MLDYEEEADPKFYCPYCDHIGMDGWMHIKNLHPDKIEEYRKLAIEEHKKRKDDNNR